MRSVVIAKKNAKEKQRTCSPETPETIGLHI